MLLLLRPADLSAKVPLDFESCFVLVDTKLFKKVIEVVLKQAFQNFELHHVVVVGGIPRLGLANLIHVDAF